MMAETEGSLPNDREVIGRDSGSGTTSPSRTTASIAEDALVMGAHSWPALADAAQQPRPRNPLAPAPRISISNTTQLIDTLFLYLKPKPRGKTNPGRKNPSGRLTKNNHNGHPLPYLVHDVPYDHLPPVTPMVPQPPADGPRNFIRPPFEALGHGYIVGPGFPGPVYYRLPPPPPDHRE